MFDANCQKTVSQFYGRPVKAGDVGIEIEIEGRHLDEVVVKNWQVHREDSLRNGGVEYVSKGPVQIADVFKNVFNIQEAMDRAGAKPNLKSHLGSTHIHVNVLGETMGTVMGIAVLWTIVEPIVMRLCGPMRDGNLFCLPCYDAGDMLGFMEAYCDYVDTGGMRGRMARGKYGSINFGRLNDFGTVEFRCFPTSIDPAKVQMWANWLVAIRNQARRAQDKSFMDAVRFAEQNPEAFLKGILPGAPIAELKAAVAPDTLGNLIDFGAAQAFELTRVIKRFRNKLIKEEKAPAPKLFAKKVKAAGFGIHDF